MRRALAISVGAGLMLALSSSLATAAEVHVVTVGALKAALEPIAADFTKATGNPVKFTFTNPANLSKTLSEGKFDAIIAAASSVSELDKSGTLAAGSHVKVTRVGIGVAVKEGAPKPDLSTPDAFKKAIMSARNIVYTDPSTPNGSGVVTMRILAAAGLVDVVKAKGKQAGLGPGKEMIAKGEFEMGLFNASEATAPGVVLAGTVPAPLQQYTNYDGGVMGNAAAKDAAATFIKFATGKEAAPRWKAGGAEAM